MARYKMRDLVVVLPGITGSVLSREAGDRQDVWNLSGQALWSFLKSNGDSLDRLAVPEHDPRGTAPITGVVATGLVNGFHGVFGLAKIDGYQPLYEVLRARFDVTAADWSDSHPANLVSFPYDWRMSNRASAQAFDAAVRDKLKTWRDFSGEPEAKLILVAHSMGGLVARYWLEVLEGWRDTRALVSFGTPYRGSLDAVGYVANGYKKAFVDMTKVLLSCPSVYELLPIYRSIKFEGNWHRPSEIALPVLDPALERVATRYITAAAEFHDEIRSKVQEHAEDAEYRNSYVLAPFVGVHQSTQQSAVLAAGELTVNTRLPEWIEDDLEGGDGTVPRVSAIPIEMESAFGATFVGAKHSGLQNVASALDDLIERLRQSQSRHLKEIQGSFSPGATSLDLVVDDLFLREEPVQVQARLVDRDENPVPAALRAVLTPSDGLRRAVAVDLAETDGYASATLHDLAPGRYRVKVEVADPRGPETLPVTDVFEVAGDP